MKAFELLNVLSVAPISYEIANGNKFNFFSDYIVICGEVNPQSQYLVTCKPIDAGKLFPFRVTANVVLQNAESINFCFLYEIDDADFDYSFTKD